MVVRKTARREVRLDPEDDRLLEEELRERDLTFAAWVREQLEAAREARERRRREEAIDRLLAARLDVHWDARDPDPATTLLNELSAERVRSLDPGA
jgi:hypothetical protein